MKRTSIVLFLALSFILAAFALAFARINLSALPEPGTTETYLAIKFKHFYVRRVARAPIPNPPADLQASIDDGEKLFGTECGACHGLSGGKPTDAGRWMYPRAADLTSEEVKQYSDKELYWIIKNGIRFSGMPAFGNVEPSDHIWDLVHYLRTLPAR